MGNEKRQASNKAAILLVLVLVLVLEMNKAVEGHRTPRRFATSVLIRVHPWFIFLLDWDFVLCIYLYSKLT